jgi:hypothetical protein
MLPIYGEKCLSRQAVSNWVQKFSEGRTRIEDEHRVGRPMEIATEANGKRFEDLIRADVYGYGALPYVKNKKSNC